MKNHSEPRVYIILTIATIIFLVIFILGGGLEFIFILYLVIGFLFSIITEFQANFIRMLFLWYPAMFFDKPEWLR